MKNIAILGLLACSVGVLGGCQSPAAGNNAVNANDSSANGVRTTANVNAVPDTTTLKGDWYLQDIGHTPVAEAKNTYLRFNTSKSSFTGNTGCNAVNGLFWYSDSDTSLVFADHFSMTRMACPGNGEQDLIKSLKKVNHYGFKNGKLILMADSAEISVWSRVPPAGKLARS